MYKPGRMLPYSLRRTIALHASFHEVEMPLFAIDAADDREAAAPETIALEDVPELALCCYTPSRQAMLAVLEADDCLGLERWQDRKYRQGR